jgi:hypothetical protein
VRPAEVRGKRRGAGCRYGRRCGPSTCARFARRCRANLRRRRNARQRRAFLGWTRGAAKRPGQRRPLGIREVELPHVAEVRNAEAFANSTRQTLREPRDHARAVVGALLTALLHLHDLTPDEPIRLDHRRVHRTRDVTARRFDDVDDTREERVLVSRGLRYHAGLLAKLLLLHDATPTASSWCSSGAGWSSLMLGDPMEITAREPGEIRGLGVAALSVSLRRPHLYAMKVAHTRRKEHKRPCVGQRPDGQQSQPSGTVDHRVTVPEEEGRLLTASRLLSSREHARRARTPSRTKESLAARSLGTLCANAVPGARGVRSSRKRGAKKKRPRGSPLGAAVHCAVGKVRTTDEMAPHSRCSRTRSRGSRRDGFARLARPRKCERLRIRQVAGGEPGRSP